MVKFRRNKTKKVASEANSSEMNGVDVEESESHQKTQTAVKLKKDSDVEESESHQKTQKVVKLKKDSDVDEGKTIFVRNLSFETTEEALRLFMTNIAPVQYCLLCKDKEVDQSKGSAFVKFKRVEDADRVVSMDQDQLLLDGRKLKVDFALPRNVVQKKEERKDRDKRNLYLAREGLIYAGSPAADGVSKQDLEKRLLLEGKKRQLLQKLTNFVSKTRLCVHNVPPDFDNVKLKKLFLDSNIGAKIVECRIMKNRSATGRFGSNKGFAFVEFEKHEHALKSLRRLNNNPHVFTDTRRPIVEFAVEDKLALNKRLRQRAKNQQAKKKDERKRKENEGKRKENEGKRKENEGKRKEEKTMEEKFSSSSNATKILKSADKSRDENKNDSEGKESGKEVSEPRVRRKREKKEKKEHEKVNGDDERDYSGFIAEPLKASEPVVAPKLNRKLGEAKKLIAEKVRQKKFEEKKEKTKKEHLSRRQLKIARRKEAKALESKKKIPKELDDFEEHFVKKTGAKILVDDRHDGMDMPKKKSKWFRDD